MGRNPFQIQENVSATASAIEIQENANAKMGGRHHFVSLVHALRHARKKVEVANGIIKNRKKFVNASSVGAVHSVMNSFAQLFQARACVGGSTEVRA